MSRTRATVQEISEDDVDEFDFPLPVAAPSPSQTRSVVPSAPAVQSEASQPRMTRATDTSQYKTWTCVYPIYFDAKRPYKTGERRVPKAKAFEWPLAQDMAESAHRLGLQIFFEPEKQHPRDWENPGRIKVLLRQDGNPVHPIIQDKRNLLLKLAAVMPKRTSQQPLGDRISELSPAVSYGFLESAIANGGMPGMPGMPGFPPGMMPQLGGGADGAGGEGSSESGQEKKGKKRR